MTISVEERFDSRSRTTGSDGSIRLRYIVLGTDDDQEAIEALAGVAPASFRGLYRGECEVSDLFVDEDNPEESIMEAVVPYQPLGKTKSESYEPPVAGDVVESFDMTSGTEHLTQSIRTLGRYLRSDAPVEKALDCQGGIKWNGQECEGVDMEFGIFAWPERWYIADADMTWAYKRAIARCYKRINKHSFRGWLPADVLLYGARGSKRVQGDWELTFEFHAIQTETNIRIPGLPEGAEEDDTPHILIPVKRGWDYVWLRKEPKEDTAAGKLGEVPVEAYLEQLYKMVDFDQLHIGV